jgi:hypothetical protein
MSDKAPKRPVNSGLRKRQVEGESDNHDSPTIATEGRASTRFVAITSFAGINSGPFRPFRRLNVDLAALALANVNHDKRYGLVSITVNEYLIHNYPDPRNP